MTKRGRTLLSLATVLAVCFGALGLWLLGSYVRAVGTWSDESRFSKDVADGVRDAVAEGVNAALQRADAELSDVRITDKRLTVDDLARLRELLVAGRADEVRRELESRFTLAELRELKGRLESMRRAPSKP
jgi:hypothetical protein